MVTKSFEEEDEREGNELEVQVAAGHHQMAHLLSSGEWDQLAPLARVVIGEEKRCPRFKMLQACECMERRRCKASEGVTDCIL
jgi:hypothetical protein